MNEYPTSQEFAAIYAEQRNAMIAQFGLEKTEELEEDIRQVVQDIADILSVLQAIYDDPALREIENKLWNSYVRDGLINGFVPYSDWWLQKMRAGFVLRLTDLLRVRMASLEDTD